MAALNVTGNINISSGLSEAITLGLASATLQATGSYQQQWANGTGASKINQSITKSTTLAISTPVTLTLSAIADDLARSIVFTKIREFVLKNNGLGTLTIGNAAANPWVAPFGSATDKIKIPPGGVLVLVAPDANGYAVGVGASDQLKLDPGAAACPYELYIKGE